MGSSDKVSPVTRGSEEKERKERSSMDEEAEGGEERVDNMNAGECEEDEK